MQRTLPEAQPVYGRLLQGAHSLLELPAHAPTEIRQALHATLDPGGPKVASFVMLISNE